MLRLGFVPKWLFIRKHPSGQTFQPDQMGVFYFRLPAEQATASFFPYRSIRQPDADASPARPTAPQIPL